MRLTDDTAPKTRQAVAVEGNFLFDKAGHRDFLGAVLGTGIAREKVRGDESCVSHLRGPVKGR